MSRRRRNKGKGKVDGRIIRRRRDFSEDFWTCCEHRVLGLWLLIREALSCWRFWARRARISVDILELGSFPSWQGGQ
jgi:hypothetical protein